MENEKLFEFMEKIYSELQSTKIEMREGFKELRIGKEILENKVDSIEKTVLKIEDEHGKKIEALLDGYKQNSEQLNRIETEVSKHDEFILKRVQ